MNLRNVVPAVVSAIETETSVPVGNNRLPGSNAEILSPPFAIVYHLSNAADVTSYTSNPWDMMWVAVQVTSVGKTANQAEWMADRCREAVLGRTAGDWTQPIEPDGATVCGRSLFMSAGTVLEEGMWQTVEQFRLMVTGE